MVSLNFSLSRSTSHASIMPDDWEQIKTPPLLLESAKEQPSASSSTSSLVNADAEDLTITTRRSCSSSMGRGSIDDLRLLAISSNMTELSYNISDIQTRIFEIQELRHQSQATQNPTSSSTSVIDQALMNLNERLETVNRGMKTVADALEPFSSQTPKLLDEMDGEDERSLLLRKHATLVSDWEAVQDESEVLREELKEDKWLTVFRTVSEQADGMMSSLEKAIKRCQDFIWRVYKKSPSEDQYAEAYFADSSPARDPSTAPVTYETFLQLQESFEAKKKHYMPATTKVLSIIDKGVQDRVTKNGECLRRHAESTQRWRNLRDRISRTDIEMENLRKVLLAKENETSEVGSFISERTSKSSGAKLNGHLATPPSSEGSRGRTSTLSRSMSPFRKLAKRITKVSGRATPTQLMSKHPAKVPASDPVPTLRHRGSLFPLRGMTNTLTPDRPTHKHSQSFTPDSPTARRGEELAVNTLKFKPPKWNSSTKVQSEEPVRTIKPALSKRSSTANLRKAAQEIPPVPPLPHQRSASRSSFASSRPWSPITASAASTTRSSISPSSRAHSPSGSRIRPKTPSHIPTPVFWQNTSGASDASSEDRSPPNSSLMQRLSPTPSSSAISAISSYSRAKTPLGSQIPHPRPPSRSMIPIPKFQFSSASRPPSAMSDYDRPESSMSFRTSAFRAQTPESILRSRVSQLPFYQDPSPPVLNSTPSGSRRVSRLPPSSFRESSATPSLSRSFSRPPSRSGAQTPSFDASVSQKYVPANPKDPLDAEIAAVVNAIPHSLLVERIDPPLRIIPKENEEIKAQYAFSNQLARKVVTCRLLTMSRSGVKSKKVMCRVGGGWQDLQLYILNRQAGI